MTLGGWGERFSGHGGTTVSFRSGCTFSGHGGPTAVIRRARLHVFRPWRANGRDQAGPAARFPATAG